MITASTVSVSTSTTGRLTALSRSLASTPAAALSKAFTFFKTTGELNVLSKIKKIHHGSDIIKLILLYDFLLHLGRESSLLE